MQILSQLCGLSRPCFSHNDNDLVLADYGQEFLSDGEDREVLPLLLKTLGLGEVALALSGYKKQKGENGISRNQQPICAGDNI